MHVVNPHTHAVTSASLLECGGAPGVCAGVLASRFGSKRSDKSGSALMSMPLRSVSRSTYVCHQSQLSACNRGVSGVACFCRPSVAARTPKLSLSSNCSNGPSVVWRQSQHGPHAKHLRITEAALTRTSIGTKERSSPTPYRLKPSAYSPAKI